MLLSRTFSLGLVVFAVVLLAGTVVEKLRTRDDHHATHAVSELVTVVDVARGVDAGALASLVRLRADERVVAVDDRPVDNDFAVGAAIAERAREQARADQPLGSGKYLDLTVANPAGRRRVLVLMH